MLLIFVFCFGMFCFVLFCFVLFCFVLFCFVLFCFVLFCFVLFLCFFLLDLDCHEQGWYLHRTTTGDQNKKSSEEYFKYQNYLYLIVTTIPVKVIVIRNTKLFCTFFNVLEVFYKHHIYVLFFSFVLFFFVLFCFVLFCFVLFCFVLFCFVLFCFVLSLFRLLFFFSSSLPSHSPPYCLLS